MELGTPQDMRTEPDVQFRINQGVSKQREQRKVFKLISGSKDKVAVKSLISAAYRQVFERDIASNVTSSKEFTALESKLSNGEITVKEFIESLGYSRLYLKEFYTPYPNTKVIELGTKHFLGRAPLDQAEIRKYNQILATQGIRTFINAMVNSAEYIEAFGEDTVPYNRFLTLPAANFPNTQRLYNQLTKQNKDLVVPSFDNIAPRMDAAKLPLTGKAIADMTAQKTAENLYSQLGRTISHPSKKLGNKPRIARIYHVTANSSSKEVNMAINAIYFQVLELSSDEVPQSMRLPEMEGKLRKQEISVRDFFTAFVQSAIYSQRFLTSYPP